MMLRALVVLLALLAASCGDDPTRSSGEQQPGAVLFLSNRHSPAGDRDIYAMTPAGDSVRRLTTSPYDDARPTWSPDGRRIAFVSQRDSVLVGSRWLRAEAIYVMNADGSGVTALTEPVYAGAGGPAWSPDGRRIAFSRREQWSSVWIMNADGSGKTRLTFNTEWDDFFPTFTPDGSRILFISNRPGPGGPWWRLFSMNVDGSDMAELPRPYVGSNITWYDLSPDGSRIAFSLDGTLEIYSMTVNGTDLVRITTNAAEDTHPVWSPDGARLVFTSLRDGNYEVYSIASNGTDLRRLTTDPAADLALAWRR